MRARNLLLLVVAAGAAVLAPAAIPASGPQLIGTVGPGYNITLERPDGTMVTALDPGTYEVLVRDLSDEHNFHLFGPGVNETTQVGEIRTVTWTVTFANGRYTLQCDPHSSELKRTFVSGTLPPAPPPKPRPAPKLVATVGPKSTISLRSATGRLLKTLKAGNYSITVRDRSTLHNFHLVGKGVNRRTGSAATGTVTWKVKLAAGVLRFYSDRAPRTVKGSLVVRKP